jgi:hypothetical protein
VNASFPSRGLNRVRPEGEDREASSGVIYACHTLARCHVILGLVLLTLAVVVPWWLYEKSRLVKMITEANNWPPTDQPDLIKHFGVACGAIALLNATVLFRCSAGLKRFARSRRVVDMHPAVRRLRTMWLVFGISMLAVVGALIYMLHGNMFVPKIPGR